MKRVKMDIDVIGWAEGDQVAIWLYPDFGLVGIEMIYWPRKKTGYSIRHRVSPQVAREIAEGLLQLADKVEKEG